MLELILPFLGPAAKVLGTVVELFRGKNVTRNELQQTVQRTVQEELQRTPAYVNTPAPRRSLVETALIGVVVLAVLKADQWSDLRIGQTADGLQFGAQRGSPPSDQNLRAVLLNTIEANPSALGVDQQFPYGPPAIEAPGQPQDPYGAVPDYGPVYTGYPTGDPYGPPPAAAYGPPPASYEMEDDTPGYHGAFQEVVLDGQVLQPVPVENDPQRTGPSAQEPQQHEAIAADGLIVRHNEVMALVESRPTSAARMMKVILEEMATTLGSDHETTVLAHSNYAFILGRADQYAESVQEYEKALPSITRAFGDDHQFTIFAWTDYGFQLLKNGDSPAALETFEAILPALEAARSADDEEVMFIRQIIESSRRS